MQRTNDGLMVISTLDGKINKTPLSIKTSFSVNMDLCASQGQMTKLGPTQLEAKPRVGLKRLALCVHCFTEEASLHVCWNSVHRGRYWSWSMATKQNGECTRFSWISDSVVLMCQTKASEVFDCLGSSLYLDRGNFYKLRVLRVTPVSVFSFIVPAVQLS